ncbi:MAG TPA: DMT family transporter, partial [Anaerolineaceae bacterium]
SSVVLVTTTPLWVAIFSPLLLHERLDKSVWVGLGLALVGGAVVGISDACRVGTVGISCPAPGSLLQGRAMAGNFLALVGAWCAAGYLMIGRRLRARLSLQTYTTFVYGVAGLVLVVLVAAARQAVTGFSPLIYLWLLCLAVIPQVLGHSTYNWSLRYLPVTMVSVSLLGEPIGSTILAYLLLGETPTAVKLFGGLLILAGIYLAARRAAAPESDALLVDAS